MSMGYIRRCYGVPAKRGGNVKFRGMDGTITGSHNSHLRVKLQKPDGKFHKVFCHPTWEMEYLVKEKK